VGTGRDDSGWSEREPRRKPRIQKPRWSSMGIGCVVNGESPTVKAVGMEQGKRRVR
jgi:hypothetical protein